VRGLGTAGLWVAHQLAVAVIGRHQQSATSLLHRFGDAAEAGIDRLDGLDSGRQAAGARCGMRFRRTQGEAQARQARSFGVGEGAARFSAAIAMIRALDPLC
jgi:hypothetical protein